jgi:hypothetical protein
MPVRLCRFVLAVGAFVALVALPSAALAAPSPAPGTVPSPPTQATRVCLPGLEHLTYFLSNLPGHPVSLPMENMQCDQANERAGAPTTDAASGDMTQPLGDGIAYWRSSSGFTVYTDGATHWAVCAAVKPPAVQQCSVNDDRDGFVWSTGEIDPPADLPTFKQQAAQDAAQRRAEQFGGMSNDDIRLQIAELQVQVDALTPQAQCGTFQLGDNLAAYRSCVQQAAASTMAQSQQLQLQIAALQREVLQRSLGN